MQSSMRYCLVSLLAVASLVLAGCNSDSNDAQIRMLNVSQGYSSLDLYLDSNKIQSAIASSTISNYSAIAPDTTHTIAITSNAVAVSSALQSLSESLDQKSHKTYVAYGDTGHFATMEIAEDQTAPSGSYTSLEVLNTATDAGAVDVYLTSASVSLDDASPNFSDVATGSSAAFTSISSGTYRLRITATGSKTDVRLDIASVTFNSGQVASLIVTGTSGGVLVNAVILPQQGSPTVETNPDARVRAALGMATGSSVTATIGGVSLMSGAPVDTIGDYVLVPVGSQSATLTVDGTAATIASQTLTAGSDYTLLFWTNSSGTQATLLTDDNQLPNSGYANIRLIHAMSGLNDAISLSVDYSPTATDVALGSASSYSQVAASTSSQLTVTDASTSASLFSQGSVTLNSEEVYTLFMFGSSSASTGTLRADR